MYDYFNNKEVLGKIGKECSAIIKALECELRKIGLNSQFFLVGSGGRNMITRNGNGPIDFDYNLNILYFESKDERELKELVRNTFNKVLNKAKLKNVGDSTSSLTTKPMYLEEYPDIDFSIDLAIVKKDNKGNWYRLIHEKTGITSEDKYYWNIAPNSKEYKQKSIEIKRVDKWGLVRKEYLKIKNKYLQKNLKHPSFVCYIESINNTYNTLKQKHLL